MRLEKGGYQGDEDPREEKLGEATEGGTSREHCRGQKAGQGVGAEAREVTGSALQPLSGSRRDSSLLRTRVGAAEGERLCWEQQEDLLTASAWGGEGRDHRIFDPLVERAALED